MKVQSQLRKMADEIDAEVDVIARALELSKELLEAYVRSKWGDYESAEINHPVHELKKVLGQLGIYDRKGD